MLRKLLLFFGHTLLIIIGTVLTQVGGLIYLITILIVRKTWHRVAVFGGLYLVVVFLIIPLLAPLFGRERIAHSPVIRPVNYFTVLTNRNYVDPAWNAVLSTVANEFATQYPGIQIQYMDANFPFINGFPLLPHLSHDDGKKLDLALIYAVEGTAGNHRASWSGYGKYVEPFAGEVSTAERCKSQGHWQYDLTKYLGWGGRKGLDLATVETAHLIRLFLEEPGVRRIFVEPHLKSRMGLTSSQIRFQGCHSVRHDDHIHLELH